MRPDRAVDDAMARQLVVVSREHPDLYIYLAERFARRAHVEVILNRRLGERRRETVAVAQERRLVDRRARPNVDAGIRARSHVIVIIP